MLGIDGPVLVEIAELLSELTSSMVETASRTCLDHRCHQDGLCFLPQVRQDVDEQLQHFINQLVHFNSHLSNHELQVASLDFAKRVSNMSTIPGCSALQSLLSQGEVCSFAIHHVLECGKGLSETSRLMMSKLHSIQIGFVFPQRSDVRFVEGLGACYEDVLVSLLREQSVGTGTLRAAEIGVHDGHTSEMLMMEFPTLEMLLVDPFDEAEEKYFEEHSLYPDRKAAAMASEHLWQRLKIFKSRSVILWQRSPNAAAWVADGLFNLIFLDASHTYEAVQADLTAWLPKLSRFGILAGHDYSLLWPGVCKAVHDFSAENNFSLMLGPDGLWWFRV